MVVLISGASKGIGKAIAMAFAAKGWNIIVGARNQEGLNVLKQEVLEKYPSVKIYAQEIDFTDKEKLGLFVESAIQEMGEINVLVNNVGAYMEDTVVDENSHLEEMLQVNLISAYNLTRKVEKSLKKGSSIINICSVLSKNSRTQAASYTIAKHALYGFNNTLREEMRPRKIKVTAILPGSVHTPSWDTINVNKEDLIQAEDVAKAVLFAVESSPSAVVEEILIRPINFDNN
jgi:3-oxoacyl-[acyl-carrier protein] reductase